jgi:hypothetical protein
MSSCAIARNFCFCVRGNKVHKPLVKKYEHFACGNMWKYKFERMERKFNINNLCVLCLRRIEFVREALDAATVEGSCSLRLGYVKFKLIRLLSVTDLEGY